MQNRIDICLHSFLKEKEEEAEEAEECDRIFAPIHKLIELTITY